MDPFTRLPNEIIDAIFIHLQPEEVWQTQQCSASTERALDPHLRTRRHAIDYLMWWACETGNNQAVRKAVSLGADVSILRALPGQSSEFPPIFCASHHLDTANLLLDLGARFDIDIEGISGERRENLERELNPEFFQLCSDRGITHQFIDFQDCIDYCLYLQIQNWGFGTLRDDAEGMRRISILLELGASSVTIIHYDWNPIGTTISYLIRCIHDWYYNTSASWCLPILKLLLSKRPDLNAPSLEMTQRFLEDPNVPLSWDACFCPIATAVGCMVALGTTEAMDMLLEAGAKLDLPVHPCFQPLALYPYLTETHDGPGYKYLESHGASFEPLWHPGESVDDDASIPIFQLCQGLGYFSTLAYDGSLLFDDKLFGVMKLFIERGAVKNVGIRFIEDVLRLMGDAPYDADKQSTVIERSHILLKLILRDDNFNPKSPGEIHELISEIVDQAFAIAPGSEQVLYFSNIIDPVLIAMLLQKGARLETCSRTKEVRDHVISQLQRGLYNIRIDI